MKAATAATLTHRFLLITIALAVLVVQLLTLREGQGWTGDFALYVAHAKNIVESRAYFDTGYLPNPQNPFHSPRAYPPVYPLLLAPVYAARGLDLDALKLVAAALLPLALVFSTSAFATHLGTGERVAIISVLGFSPYLVQFKNHILSDIPFLLTTSIAILCLDASRDGGVLRRRLGDASLGALNGAAMLVAIETRTVGVALVAALPLYAILVNRRVELWQAVAMVVAAVGSVVIGRPLLGGDGYTDAFAVFGAGLDVIPIVVRDNARAYWTGLAAFWSSGGLPAISAVAAIATLAASVAGYVGRLRHGLRVVDVFVPLYFAAILVWPGGEDIRLALPILPALFCYAAMGVSAALENSSRRVSLIARATLCACIAGAFTVEFSSAGVARAQPNVADPDATELFSYIRTHVGEQATIVAGKPRIITLFTGRRGAVLHVGGDDASRWAFLGRVAATHVVLSRWHWDRSLGAFVRANSDRFRLLFNNASYGVYEIDLTP